MLTSAWVLPVSVAHLTLTTVSLGAEYQEQKAGKLMGLLSGDHPAGNGMLFV